MEINSALAIAGDGNFGVRTDSFPVDHGKIYRVALKLRKTTAGGQHLIGLSGFTVPTAGISGLSFYSGTEVLIPYLTTRVETTPLANFYFLAATTASDAWEEHVYYVIGANRSVMDCPEHVGTGTRPFVKLPSTCRHIALRVLNWANSGVLRVLQAKDVSVSEVTAGQIVAANLVDGAVTDAKIAGMAASKVTGQLTDAQIAAVAAAKLTGQIAALQIADGAVTDAKIVGMAASKVTGQLTDAQIAAVAAAKVAGQLTSEQIADAAIGIAKFAAGLRPVEIVSALPTTGNFAGRVVFLETDGKIYRHDGTSFVASVPAADIAGQVQAAQIAALEAAKITGLLSDAQISALSAAKLAGQITQTQITDGSISTGKLAAAAVVADKIATSAITADKVAANAITAAKISAGAVEAAKIAAGAVVAGKIGAGAVLAGTVAAGAITAGNLAADAVTAGTIAAGAISAREIAAGSITSGKLLVRNADNLVPNPDFATGDLASWYPWSGAANMSVVAANAAGVPAGAPSLNVCKFTASGGTVGIFSHESAYTEDGDGIAVAPGDQFLATIDVAAEADVTAPLHLIPWYRTVSRTNASNTFTCTPVAGAWTRYSFNITIPANVYKMHMYVRWNSSAGGPLYWTNLRVIRRNTGELIVDGAITANKIGAGEVVAGKIAAGAVVADNIAVNAVTAVKISAGEVEAAKIAAGAVQADKIAAGAVLTDKLAANAVTAGKIAAGAVTADTIETGAITAGKLSADAVTAGTVAAGAIGAAEIAAGAIVASKIAVGDYANLVADHTITDAAYWNLRSAWTLITNPANTGFDTAGSLRYPYTVATTWGPGCDSGRFAVEAGREYRLRYQTYSAPGQNRRVIGRLVWYDAAGVNLASPDNVTTVHSATRSGGLSVEAGTVTAPAGAKFALVQFIVSRTETQGDVLVGGITLRARAGGELIVDGAISAQHLNTGSLAVAGVSVFGGVLASSNYATGASGWRVSHAGDAEFNSLIVRRGMLDIGAAAIEASAYAGGTITKTANAMAYGEDLVITVSDAGLAGKPVWITYAAEVELTRSTIGYVEARSTLAGAVSLDTYRARVYIPVANGVLRLPFIATRRLIAPAGSSWQFSSQPHMENLPAGVTGSVTFAKRALILRANMDQ